MRALDDTAYSGAVDQESVSLISLKGIYVLPVDVLLYILAHCVDSASIKSSMCLAAVCRCWRTLALSVSDWWTHITIEKGNPECLSIARGVMSRAKEKPIYLTLPLVAIHATQICGKDLIPFVQKARTLTMRADMVENAFHGVPELPVEYLDLTNWNSPNHPFGSHSTRLPNLRDIRFFSVHLYEPLPSHLPLQKITKLELSALSEFRTICICLRSLPNLKHLVFDHIDLRQSIPWSALQAIDLPKLVTLDFKTCRQWELVVFMTTVIIEGCLSVRKLGIPGKAYLQPDDIGWANIYRGVTHLCLESSKDAVKICWRVFETLEYVDIEKEISEEGVRAIVNETKRSLKALRCNVRFPGEVLWERKESFSV